MLHITGRPRKYASNADRQKAYRTRVAKRELRNLETALSNKNMEIIAEVTAAPFTPTIDTRSWSWQKWVNYFLDQELLPHQVENLELLEKHKRAIINDPRQHGKTNYVVKPFILRRLCETYWTGANPILYISHSGGGVQLMTLKLKQELITNDKITEVYGEILDYETHKQSRLQKQTQNIINLKNAVKRDAHSFQGISTASKIRGTSGIRYTIIDDPIDLEKEEEYVPATKKFLQWFKYKILPFCRGGHIFIIGTRYGVKDLYTTLLEERLYNYYVRSAVSQIHPYTINYPEDRALIASDIFVEDETVWKLLAPTLWQEAYNGSTVQNIIYEMVNLGDRATQQELMNNPLPVNPKIKWEWFNFYSTLPRWGTSYKWAVMVDIGAGESQSADYTAMVLVGIDDRSYDFYIHDFIYGRWTGLQKVEKLEEMVDYNATKLTYRHYVIEPRDISVLIETLYGQRDLFQRVRDESWITPRPVAPTKRGQKEDRITHGLGQEMENSKVYINENIRNKTQLRLEVDGFPMIDDNHALDAIDQCIYNLKMGVQTIKAGWV